MADRPAVAAAELRRLHLPCVFNAIRVANFSGVDLEYCVTSGKLSEPGDKWYTLAHGTISEGYVTERHNMMVGLKFLRGEHAHPRLALPASPGHVLAVYSEYFILREYVYKHQGRDVFERFRVRFPRDGQGLKIGRSLRDSYESYFTIINQTPSRVWAAVTHWTEGFLQLWQTAAWFSVEARSHDWWRRYGHEAVFIAVSDTMPTDRTDTRIFYGYVGDVVYVRGIDQIFVARGINADVATEVMLPTFPDADVEGRGDLTLEQTLAALDPEARLNAAAPHAQAPQPAAPQPAPPPVEVGDNQRGLICRMDEVQVLEQPRLGHGSTCEVVAVRFRHEDAAMKRQFALAPDGDYGTLTDEEMQGVSRSILRELGLLAELRSDYVCALRAVVCDGNRPTAVIMERLQAVPRVMAQERFALFAHNVARGLQDLHERGIIHRDIKPSNVLFDQNTGKFKVSDLGEAQQYLNGTTATATLRGTLDYLAPEVLAGVRGNTAIDMFAYGVTLMEIFGGRNPNPSPMIDEQERDRRVSEVERRREEIAALPDGDIKDLIVRCLADDPNTRPTARECAEFFEAQIVRNILGH